MNLESGYGTNGVPYEYTVSEAKSKTLLFKRITLIALYCLWVVGWLLVGLWFQLIVPFLALIPITLWILVLATWHFTQVEYEYSFFAGALTVSRIRGNRWRKKLAEVTIRELSALYPCDDAHSAQIDAFHEDRTVFAASSTQAPDLYVAFWSDEEHGKTALYFEPNEKALKILRYYNFSVSGSVKR